MPSVPPARRDRSGFALAVLLGCALVGAAAVLTLAAPPSDPGRAAAACFYLLPLPRDRQLAFNCDSFTFLRGAVAPALLLEPSFAPPTDFTYQTRPLHIGLAAVLGRLLQPWAERAVPAEARYQGRTPLRRFAGAYAAYVLINAGLLVLAAIAFHDAVIGRDRTPAALETWALLGGLAFVILSGDVKMWLLTPHTMLWGVLIPLWALAIGRRILADPAVPSAGRLARTGGAAGLAALAYGFAVLVPATAAALLGLRLTRVAAPTSALARGLRLAGLAAGLFVVPPLAWIAVSYAVSGGFHSHEAVAYRQFRWLPDALALGPATALTAAGARARLWAGSLADHLAAPGLALAVLLAAGRVAGLPPRELASRLAPLLRAAVTVVVLGVAFWYLNGSLEGDRATTVVPVVWAVVAAVALELDRRAAQVRWTALLATAALGSGAWTLGGRPLF